jgi:hypothetical protein
MTTTIGPALGHGPWTQQGTGATPGYDAIDVRRLLQGVAAEGVISSGGYAVTQRGAGANLSVDIAASTGEGARVQGDAVTLQGLYYVPPASAVINETITAAHATLPRNDLVVLEIKDTQHDASGSSLAQTRVVAGTATAGAAQTDALGVNGTPTLPSSAIALAVVNVPATDTTITTSQIDDRRPQVWRGGSGGKSVIATEETRTNTAYGTLATPDVVRSVTVPDGALVLVGYQAKWKNSVASTARAALFLGATQLQARNDAAPAVQEASGGSGTTYGPLATTAVGLQGHPTPAAASDAAADASPQLLGITSVGGGLLIVDNIAAGTYDFSVQFKSSSGTVSVKERRLKVAVLAFG